MQKPLEPKQHAAILAGLRLLQKAGNNLPLAIEDIATNGGEHDVIDADDIDALCEELNVEGCTLGVAA